MNYLKKIKILNVYLTRAPKINSKMIFFITINFLLIFISFTIYDKNINTSSKIKNLSIKIEKFNTSMNSSIKTDNKKYTKSNEENNPGVNENQVFFTKDKLFTHEYQVKKIINLFLEESNADFISLGESQSYPDEAGEFIKIVYFPLSIRGGGKKLVHFAQLIHNIPSLKIASVDTGKAANNDQNIISQIKIAALFKK